MKRLVDYLFPARPPLLRAAMAADISRLAELHAAAFARGWEGDEFERLLSEAAVRAHVATPSIRAAPIGFVISHVVPPEAEILTIVVAEEQRGRGIGRALLTHHLSRLAADGVTTSLLEVESENHPALALYRDLGYEAVGRRKAYYGHNGADALLLRLTF